MSETTTESAGTTEAVETALASTVAEAQASVIETNQLALEMPNDTLLIASRNRDLLREIFKLRLSIEAIEQIAFGGDAISTNHKSFGYPLRTMAGFPTVDDNKQVTGKKTGRVNEKRFKELNKRAINKSRVANLIYALAHDSTTINLGSFAAHQISLLSLYGDDKSLPGQGVKGYGELSKRFLGARINAEETHLDNDQSFKHMLEHVRAVEQGRRIDILVPVDTKAYKYNDVLLRHHAMVTSGENMRAVRMTMDLVPLIDQNFWIYYARAANLHDVYIPNETNRNKRFTLSPQSRQELLTLVDVANEYGGYITTYYYLARSTSLTQYLVDKLKGDEWSKITKKEFDMFMTWVLAAFNNKLMKVLTAADNAAYRIAKTYALMSEISYGMFLSHLFPMTAGTLLLHAGNYFNSDKFDKGVVEPFTMREEMHNARLALPDDDEDGEEKKGTFLPGYFPVQAIFREAITNHLDDVEILIKRNIVDGVQVVTYNHDVVESLWVQLCFGLSTPQLLFDFKHNQLVPANIGYRQINADDFSIYYRCKSVDEKGERASNSNKKNSYARIPIPKGGYLFTIDNLDNATLNWDFQSFHVSRGTSMPLVDILNNKYLDLGRMKTAPVNNKTNKDLKTFAVSLVQSLAAKGAVFPDETVVRQLPYLQSILGALGEENRPAAFKELPEWLVEINETDLIFRNGPAADIHMSFFVDRDYGLEHGEEDVPKGKFIYIAHQEQVLTYDDQKVNADSRVGFFS